MKNTQILKKLEKAEENNYETFCELISQWNKNESEFPNDLEVKKYIKLDKWSKEELEKIKTEMLIKQYLPDYFLDIYFEMKEFRYNPRRELTSSQRGYARLMGYNLDFIENETKEERQNRKAAVVYDWSISKYLNDSKLNKGDNTNDC